MKVSAVMTPAVTAVEENRSVMDTAALMRQHGVGILPVVSDGQIVGVASDRDIILFAVVEGNNLSQTPVQAIMRKGVVWCHQNAPVEEAVKLMANHGVRRLLVVNRKTQPAGILSIADIAARTELKTLAGEVLGAVATKQRQRLRRAEDTSR